jgi:hypothetical protein
VFWNGSSLSSNLVSTKPDATAYHADGERASAGPQLAVSFHIRMCDAAIGMLCRAHSQRSCPFASSISIGKDLMRSLICLVAVPTSNNHNPGPLYCPMHILPLHHPLSNGKVQWPAQHQHQHQHQHPAPTRKSRMDSDGAARFHHFCYYYPLPVPHNSSPVTRHPASSTQHHPPSVLSHPAPPCPIPSLSHPLPSSPILPHPITQTLYPSITLSLL